MGNTYTALPLITNGNRLQAFYTFSTASGPDTVTGTFSGSGATYIQETLAEYSNVGAVDAHAENSGGNSQPSTTTTTTASNDLVIGYVTDSYTTWTGETGWNLRTTGSGIRAALQDTIAANPGSITSTFNTVNGWNAGVVAIKPTSSGGTNKGVLNWNANGTLQQLAITDPFNSANTQNCSFTYDDLARQSTANCGTAWNQSFSFDPFGNISKGATVGTSFNATYSSATNRITTIGSLVPTYDTNGNLTNDTAHAYTWDAEGRMLTVDVGTSGGVCDTYDALGRMVEKATGASCTSSYTEIVYAPTGGRLATMTGQTLQQASVPLVGGAEAVYNSSGLLAYRHSDHLGSSRFASTPSRTKYFDVAYAPYGEDYADSGTTDLSFTGQKKDTASWLYDFMFRKYNAAHGRWMSPDPAGMGAAKPDAPQTWNRYAYVSNSPMNAVDMLGLLEPPTCKINDISCGGIDNGGAGVWPGAGGYSGAVNGGSGVAACGIDPFCIQNGGIGPFGSPVANGKTWVNSSYLTGGDFRTQTPTPYLVLNCVGSWSSTDCSWDPFSVQYVLNGGQSRSINSLYPGLVPGDRPIGSDIFHCPGCPKLWKSANDWGTLTFVSTATVPLIVVSSPAVVAIGQGAYVVTANTVGAAQAAGLSSPFVLRWLYNVAANPTNLVMSIEKNLQRAQSFLGW